MTDSALYIHIPFCDHKCIYCDFYSIITTDNINPFLSSIKKEINYYSEIYSGTNNFNTIYFGGGTPSLMDVEFITEILDHLNNKFFITKDAEITLETNPGTVTEEKLKSFLNTGINRLSIGIQSFNDDELKFLTRIHNSKTAVQTIKSAVDAGFKNISADLIFNLPKQTKEKWLNNLKIITSLPVNHISAYSLILERGTILNKMVRDGKVTIQDEDYDAELYELTIDYLESTGFYQYEVSNFSKPGFECEHNKAYWEYRDYISFGPSAHSFADGKRWWNYSSLKKYISEIENNKIAVAGSEIIDDNQMFDEYVMLALRGTGLDINDFQNRFGSKWLINRQKYFSELEKDNFIVRAGNKIKLTKNGYALCDEILSNIL